MPAKISILLVEDDHDDVEFFKVAMEDNKIPCLIEVLNRGDLIVNWLTTTKKIPDVIILDLNLPKLHGREVLCLIKEKERFKKIPLIVLTTSSSAVDRDFCIDHGADLFLTKPSTIEGFTNLVQNVCRAASKTRKTN
jgi:DNA-binding response OmpR family regulator